MNPNDTTDQDKAAMQEVSLTAVPPDLAGVLTPARITERLGDMRKERA